MDEREDRDERQRRRGMVVPVWTVAAVGAMLVVGIALGVLIAGGGSEDGAKPAAATADGAQLVRFQKPADPGPKPFTDPADAPGRRTVSYTPSTPGGGPFGGSGSNSVCDRDRLIRFLRDNPERMRAWAIALGISPTYRAVRRYIARLHPVTLVQDTRVTNHTYEGGQAVGFQSILQAGTAVLVDDYGRPVVRCRCGNPLRQPVFIPTARCYGCPPHYTPPRETCSYWRRTTTYRRTWYPGGYYSNVTYDAVFIRRTRSGPFDGCWTAYPEPPRVRIIDVYSGPPPPSSSSAVTPAPQSSAASGPASAAFSPASGTADDTYTLSVSGFPPNTALTITLARPDGVVEHYAMTTDAGGSGAHTFPHTAGVVLGTYAATVSGGGRSASASTHVAAGSGSGGGSSSPAPAPQTDTSTQTTTSPDGLHCDPPRSQLEFEQCAAAGQG